MKSLETLQAVEKMAETYAYAIRSMLLCTVLAHKRVSELNDVADQVEQHMADWLGDYMNRFNENPVKDLGTFYQRAVFETRDAVENILGVSRKVQRKQENSNE